MARIGYARVSTEEQSLDLQIDALKKAGVAKTNIYQEKASGIAPSRARQSLEHCLASLQEGDELVIWKLDRLGRSLTNLIEIINELKDRGVNFKSLTEGIDTTTAAGVLFFNIIGSFAQFERDLISERTTAGMQAAKASGRRMGPPVKMTPDKVDAARVLLAQGKNVNEIAGIFGVSGKTIYRAVDKAPTQNSP